MPSNESTVKIKADISKLKSEMQAAARQVRVVNSEFRAATAGMDDWTKSEEGLSAKLKQLNSTLDAQKKQLDLLNQELEKTIELDGEGSAAADRVRIAINNQQAAIAKTEKDIETYNDALEELPETMEDTSDAAEKASEGFTVFKAALADLVADAIKATISAFKDLAQEAIQVGMDFESSMSKVQATSGASAEEMQQLSDKAKEMGESTVFSASQSAEAFNYMAMAGWKTEDMLDGIEGIMNLAAASGADLATTSDIVTDALTAMGYEAKDAGHLADVMAAAASNANTNVEMMGSTFQYAAPIIGALGYDMEDAAVAIGMMANAGIKGDKAGTALRSTLNRLSAPPKECATEMEKLGISLTDSEGKMKPLMRVMEELRDAFSGLSETEQTAAAKHIAGQEAMSGLLAIVNGSEKDFAKLSNAITNSAGAAESMAEVMNDNVGGQLTLLQSKIEGIMIKLFERASGSMKKGIEEIGKALDKVDWNKVGDQIGKFATKATNLFAYIITNSSRIISILKTIGTVFATIFVAQKISATVTAFSTLITVIKSASSASALMSSAMSALGLSMSALPIMAVVAGFALLGSYISSQNRQIEEQSKATYGLSKAQTELIDSINSTSQAIQNSSASMKDEGENIDLSCKKLENMKNSYNDLIDENGNVKQGYEELAQELLGNLAEGLGTTIDKIKENIDQNGKLSASIDDLIEKKKTEAKIAAFEDDYNEALKNEYSAWQNLKGAKEESAKAQQTLNEKQAEYDALMADLQKSDAWGAMGMTFEIKKATEDLNNAKESNDQLAQSLADAQKDWSQAQSTIENYEKATSAAMNNNAEEVNDALSKMQGGIVNYDTATKETLEQQVIDTKRNLDLIRQDYKDGIVNEEFVTNAEHQLSLAKSELDKFADNAGESGTKASDNLKGSVSDGLSDLQGTVEKMSGNAFNALGNGLGDWGKVAEEKTGSFLDVLDGKTGEAKNKGEGIATNTADGIKSKSSEFKAAGDENTKEYLGSFTDNSSQITSTGSQIPEWVGNGVEENSAPLIDAGNWTDKTFSDSVINNKDLANKGGVQLGKEVPEGTNSVKGEMEKSGKNFVDGFLNVIKAHLPVAWQVGIDLAAAALGGLKKKQEENSPSKATGRSGNYFVLGYVNAINNGAKSAAKAAANVAKSAIETLKKTQKEGSPSELTYNSGRMFTQGFIDGIASLEGQLVTTTKELVNKTLAELMNISNFNFSEAATTASETFSKGFQEQLDYMIKRINYENQQKAKDFAQTVSDLQAAANQAVAAAQAESQKKQDKIQKKIDKLQKKEQTKEVKKKIDKLKKQLEAEKKALQETTDQINQAYQAQINNQQKMKESYEEASSEMIEQFTKAMQEYQTAAQKLIDSTMNAISDEYQKQYDALINKQDNLINKLKSAGDLFNVSGAGVMTINDIQAQTASIKQYADKLAQIKEKVSGDLFDQIASYDMKEGEAFIDRLLAMSKDELQAYSDAYDEKMRVSEELGQNIYKKDADNIAENYKTAMAEAFKDLPKQLEELGWQSMQGFLSGLTTNTAYMEESVRTFISGMVDEFKKQLGIASPSKVTMKLGELTGEGFADGLLEMVSAVKKAAKDITQTVEESLNISDTVSDVKSLLNTSTGYATSAGSFGSNDKTQVINFTQVNNSPKALDRLSIYRQTNNILFSAKVGLSNV